MTVGGTSYFPGDLLCYFSFIYQEEFTTLLPSQVLQQETTIASQRDVIDVSDDGDDTDGNTTNDIAFFLLGIIWIMMGFQTK